MKWDNVLGLYLKLSSVAIEGLHVTVLTSLLGTRSWLGKWKPECNWVNCEVSHMGQAFIEGRTSFGYLHIVSDNVARHYPHDLSNERLQEVILDRRNYS